MHRTCAGELQSVGTRYGYTVLSQRSLSSWAVPAGCLTPAVVPYGHHGGHSTTYLPSTQVRPDIAFRHPTQTLAIPNQEHSDDSIVESVLDVFRVR